MDFRLRLFGAGLKQPPTVNPNDEALGPLPGLPPQVHGSPPSPPDRPAFCFPTPLNHVRSQRHADLFRDIKFVTNIQRRQHVNAYMLVSNTMTPASLPFYGI